MDLVFSSWSFTYVCLPLLCFLLAIYILKTHQTARKPPGPWGLPILGIYPLLGKFPHVKMSEWARKYGDVMTLPFGRSDYVLLNDCQLARELFNKEEFNGKPRDVLGNVIFKNKGLMFTDGQIWEKERRLALSSLKHFGMGKLSLEPLIHEKVDTLIGEIKLKNGQPFQCRRLLRCYTAGVITSLLFGKSHTAGEETHDSIMDKMANISVNWTGITFLHSMLPFLKYMPRIVPTFKQVISDMDATENFIKEQIEDLRKDYDPDHIRGYVDAYNSNLATEDHDAETESQLVGSVRDMYMVGVETIAVTLQWTLLYMVCNQKLQEDLQTEIDNHLGFDRKPSMSDASKMVLMSATINEVHRCASVSPLDPHVCHTDTYINGYFIKKETPIVTHMYHIHNDPKIWSSPDRFDPYRFIDSDGNLTKTNHLIPFLLGKRLCPGQELTNMEIFLTITSLLQKFRFLPETDGNMPTLDGVFGGTICPTPFKMRAVERE